MKVALVLPSITLEERYNKAIVPVAGSLPPLGLLSIATALKDAGHDVIVLDGTMLSFTEIMLKIQSFKPEILGITAMTIMWQKAKILSLELRKRWPDLKIIVGGVHASMIKEKALLDMPDIDAVAWGEGEFSMLEYVGNCARPEDARPIDGIAFRSKEGIVVGKDREPIKDLDILPVPDRSFIPVQKYIGAFEQYRRLPVTNMVTTRGCPFKCTFCLPDLLGKGVRYRSVEKVLEEIRYLINTFGIRDIAFWDDTFTLNRNRVFSLCEHIIKEKLPFIWSAQGRADCVTAEMLEMMAKAGCWKIFYGVESLVQKNLDTLKKGETVEQIFEAVKLTQKFGIEVEGSFIFGIPGETYQEGRKTIELSKKLSPDYAKFFCLIPYGQFLAEINKYGTMVSEVEKDFTGSAVLFVPYSMTKGQLNKLYNMSYLEFYLRPKMIYSKLKKILSAVEFNKSVRGLLVLAIFFINELRRRFRKGY